VQAVEDFCFILNTCALWIEPGAQKKAIIADLHPIKK